MKGSHKFWLAVSLALVVRLFMFIGMYYYDNWNTNEILRNRTFGFSLLCGIIFSFFLITAWADNRWSENDVKPFCFLSPLFYIWMLVYYINKLLNKYL